MLLNDIPITFWKADNRGNFVAKSPMTAVKDIIELQMFLISHYNQSKKHMDKS